jgi:hypothetical protein
MNNELNKEQFFLRQTNEELSTYLLKVEKIRIIIKSFIHENIC